MNNKIKNTPGITFPDTSRGRMSDFLYVNRCILIPENDGKEIECVRQPYGIVEYKFYVWMPNKNKCWCP